jgi:hypothetical protein
MQMQLMPGGEADCTMSSRSFLSRAMSRFRSTARRNDPRSSAVAAGDEDHVGDPGRGRLLDGVLIRGLSTMGSILRHRFRLAGSACRGPPLRLRDLAHRHALQ